MIRYYRAPLSSSYMIRWAERCYGGYNLGLRSAVLISDTLNVGEPWLS